MSPSPGIEPVKAYDESNAIMAQREFVVRCGTGKEPDTTLLLPEDGTFAGLIEEVGIVRHLNCILESPFINPELVRVRFCAGMAEHKVRQKKEIGIVMKLH